jgi:hypothetical protein
MPLPGGNWDITAGGTVGSMTLTQAPTGSVTGTLLSEEVVGFFDETSQVLTLLSNPTLISKGGFNNVLSTPFTVYQGSFFQFTSGSQTFSALSGTSYVNDGSGSPAYTLWYAQNPAPTKFAKEGKDGKDRKDGKEGKELPKERVIDKIPQAEKLPELQSRAESALSALERAGREALASAEGGGQAFIAVDKRPSVGGSALYDS